MEIDGYLRACLHFAVVSNLAPLLEPESRGVERKDSERKGFVWAFSAKEKSVEDGEQTMWDPASYLIHFFFLNDCYLLH